MPHGAPTNRMQEWHSCIFCDNTKTLAWQRRGRGTTDAATRCIHDNSAFGWHQPTAQQSKKHGSSTMYLTSHAWISIPRHTPRRESAHSIDGKGTSQGLKMTKAPRRAPDGRGQRLRWMVSAGMQSEHNTTHHLHPCTKLSSWKV